MQGLCGRVTGHNCAEFAPDLEMCTPKIEKGCIMTNLIYARGTLK